MDGSLAILVVEQDKALRAHLRSALEGLGHQVLDAGDCSAGLAVIERAHPDIVLADLQLNGTDGEPFVETMRRSHPATPVIALSGAGVLENALSAVQAGAWDCVSRSLASPDELELAIARIRARSRLSAEHHEYQRLLEELVAERTARLEDGMRRVSSLLANLPGMVFRCRNDRQWTMEYVSPGVAALTGYDAWKLINNAQVAYGELIVPEDRERTWSDIQKALDNKRQYQISYRIHTAGGDLRWFWEQGRGDYREDGTLAAIEGYISDISAERGAESAARLDEERLQSLYSLSRMSFAASEEAIASFALEEGVKQTGSAFGQLHFYDEQGGVLLPYLHCEEGACGRSSSGEQGFPAAGAWAEALRLQRPVIENDHAEGQGEPGCPGHTARVRRLLVVPVFEGDRIAALACVGNKDAPYDDADARQLSLLCGEMGRVIAAKRSNEHIRKLSRAAEQSPNSVVIADTKGVIEYVNPRFEGMTGIASAEACGKDLRELVLGGLDQQQQELIWTAAAGGQEWQGEISRRQATGEERWFLASCSSILDESGDITHLVMILEDITERRRLEKVLQGYSEHLEWMVAERTKEAEEARRFAEEANKAKSEFLATMSHELRSPLNVILGFSELMLSGMTGELTAGQQQNLSDIQSSGNRLLNLIDNILDLTRIETSSLSLELSPFVLKDAISAAAALVREKAAKHAIEVSLAVSGEVGAVCADERKMKQVLVNLIGNAVKFTPDGGAVRVTARRLPAAEAGAISPKRQTAGAADSAKAREFIAIAVQDSGVGIAPGDREKIFEPFHQADASYTKRFGGAGLGLSLSLRLVELHGGTIRVESEPGKGSTFTILVPDAQQEGHR